MGRDNDSEQKGRTGTDKSGPLDSELVHDILANRRRRLSMHLLQNNEEMNIRELSKQIASIEHGKDIDELDEKEIKRVYTALQQSHLPKLDDLDLIEFNKDNGNIRILPRGKNMVEMKVETVYNGMSMPLRAVLFAGTFVISVTAFTSAGIVEQITTYALPALILILMSILLLPPNKSNNKTNPPKDIDTSSETNTRATKF